MITLHDCVGLCDAFPEEVDVVASHEGLSLIVAAEKAHHVLQTQWGGPALRQMIQDEAHRARRAGRHERARDLEDLHDKANERYPGGVDRRRRSR
ncbi:hypothetical protein [Pararhodospirillum photometricum]|uniref:hypothetical protein n=1 Tax=Pararhodospirillum photometricum TaxID=1084 RepID=UPI0002FC06D1|nr:hypothetical protein [Pararhodospirillum photometricum]